MSFYRTENIARVIGPTGRILGTIQDERMTTHDGHELVTWCAFGGGNALHTDSPSKASAVRAVVDNAARCWVPPRELSPPTVVYVDPAHWKGA